MLFKSTVRLCFATSLLMAAISLAVRAENSHNDNLEEIVVRAHPLSAEGLAQAVAVVQGDELQRALSASLGETLQGIPGITLSSFGQAVGRPVIRGLAGPRVKTMEDRIDSLDVATSSPDHATTIDPFVAQSIEVLKGPSTLLYGAGAIGGVVDVHSGRILHEVPDALSGGLALRGTDNANQRAAVGRLDAGTGNIALHVDGFFRDANAYDIPGYAESDRYRAQEVDLDHDELDTDGGEDVHTDEDEAFGSLAGSQFESRGGAVGISYVGDAGFLGIALSTYETEYGLPGSHGHHEEEHLEDEADEHEEDERPPVLDLEQTRIDLEAGLVEPFNGVNSLNFRLGINDYQHREIEGEEIATLFSREAWEGRLELHHVPIIGIEGSAGIQISDSNYSVKGEEAFVQPVDTRAFGVFWVGQRDLGPLGIEMGLRVDTVELDPSEPLSRARDFNTFSASLGLIHPISERLTLSGQIDYSARAPIAEELYSFGPHLATQSFELGDENLDEETATNASAVLAYKDDTVLWSLSAYITEFGDFIYQAGTDLEEDSLAVYQWTQADATFVGVEGEASWKVASWDTGAFTLIGGFDAVKAKLAQGEHRDLPRIPPSRWWLGGKTVWGAIEADITWRKVSSQSTLAPNELATDGYDDLRVHMGYRLDLADTALEVFLNGRNLTNEEQRVHTAFIGQFAPLPGRTIEVGIRLEV